MFRSHISAQIDCMSRDKTRMLTNAASHVSNSFSEWIGCRTALHELLELKLVIF